MKTTFLFLSVFLFLATASAQNKIRYPVVIVSNGKVELIEDDKAKALKLGQSLKEKAVIKVGDKSQVKIDLSAKTSMLILENSEVQLPFIAWEDGKVEQLDLKKGRLHLVVGSGENKTVVTALSRDYLKSGEYIYTYEPLAPQIETVVLNGELEFRGLENEEFVKIKSGEKASFLGVLESGEPVYDVLLKGRKVARGKLTQVQKVAPEQMVLIKTQAEVKKTIAKKHQIVKQTEKQICQDPFAEFNQCAWICEKKSKSSKNCNYEEGSRCFRSRCNANGQWAERTELTKLESKCDTSPVVASCEF